MIKQIKTITAPFSAKQLMLEYAIVLISIFSFLSLLTIIAVMAGGE